jgi:hypothetical protein
MVLADGTFITLFCSLRLSVSLKIFFISTPPSQTKASVLRESDGSDSSLYFLEDRYMSARKYDFERGGDIIASEKQEILARLKRVQDEQTKRTNQR